MFEVADVILLRKVLKKVDSGYPHTTLKHYIKFLLQESIQSRLTSQSNSSTSHRPKAKKKLVVSFNDGTIISNDNAAETMRKTIIKIGPQRIQKLGMMRCGIPFIADFKSDNERIARSHKPVGNNLYVLTYSDAETKQKQLEEIAKRLGINIRVSIETI